MSLAGVAASGARQTLVGQLLRFVVQLVSIAVLARLLSPSDFGYFGMVAAVTGAAVLLGDFGLSAAAMQAKTISLQQRSNLFWLNFAIGAVAWVIVFAGAPVIATFYGLDLLLPIVQALSFVFVLSALSTQFYADAARSHNFRALAVADVVSPMVGLVVAVIAALLGAGVWSLVLQQLVLLATRFLIVFATVRWVPRLPRRASMGGLLSFGAAAFGVQALNYVSSSVDSILIGRNLGAASLGIYDRAFQLYKLPMQQIAAPLTRVALPLLSTQQERLQAMSSSLREVHKILILVIGAALAFLAAAGSPVVELALGEGWSDAGPIVTILVVGGFFQLSGYVYYWAFLATANTGLQLKFSVVTRLALIALIFGGVQFGVFGVAFAISLGLALNWLVMTLFPMRMIGLNIGHILAGSLAAMLAHLAAFTVVSVVGWGVARLELVAIVELLILLPAALLAYSASILISASLRSDVRQLVRFMRRSL